MRAAASRIVRRSRLPLVALAVVAVALALTAAHRPVRRPNVLLITVDTLRPDRLSAYGYDRHRTPNFDRLAAEGTLFENAFCDVTWTTPSMASVMTGLYATRHRVRSSNNFLAPEATTLAEVLRGAGYHTAAIISSFPLHSIFGLNQGFELYDETFTRPTAHNDVWKAAANDTVPDRNDPDAMARFLRHLAATEGYRSDAETSDRVVRWLRDERREPFFLWVHYFGPHEKPLGGDIFEERRRQLAAYDPDVLTSDAQVGRVLDALDELGIADDTAVILHADHGQSLLQHDYFGHGKHVYDATQRIPLIVRYPRRVPAGVRIAHMARNVDIFPTVLALTHAHAAAGDGRNLIRGVPTPRASRAARAEETYVETYLSATWLFAEIVDKENDMRVPYRRLGWRTPRWKLIINDPMAFGEFHLEAVEIKDEASRAPYYSEELYDLAADPGETANVVAEHPDVAATLRAKIRQVRRPSASGPAAVPAPVRPLDQRSRDRLRSLGYLD